MCLEEWWVGWKENPHVGKMTKEFKANLIVKLMESHTYLTWIINSQGIKMQGSFKISRSIKTFSFVYLEVTLILQFIKDVITSTSAVIM